MYPEAGIVFDADKPDGTPRKLLNVTRLHALGRKHRIPLREGLRTVCEFLTREEHAAR